MKCKSCGSDVMIKKGDWYECASCGATVFDTEIKVDDMTSPTKMVETIEKQAPAKEEQKKEQKVESTKPEKNKKKPAKADKKAAAEEEKKSPIRETIEFIIPIVVAIIVAILLKMFVFANIVVPTGSMLNTIHEKDRIIASRIEYSFSDPQRYDIVVFRFPDDETQCFIKRLVGLPGETVQVVNGVVYVTKTDGETIQLDDSFVTNCVPTGDYGPFVVPEDCYFMMGDNRNESWDSRFWTNKYVHRDQILGKAKFRYFPSIGKVE